MASPKQRTAGGLTHCSGHGENIYFDNWADCPACDEKLKQSSELSVVRAKIKALKMKNKLLRLELVEERMLHKSTQLDAAEYLAQKKLVDELVKDRLK